MDPSRITLRPLKLSDADDLLSWAGDDRVTSSGGRWGNLTSRDEALTFIEKHCLSHPWRRSICIDDRSIGFVGALPGSGDDNFKAEMGYAIAVEYWGKGITTRAVKMAIPQVFKDFPQLVRLQAFANVENKASQRVLEKAGFTKEGLLRKFINFKGQIQDVVIFSLLSTDSNYL